MYEMEKRGNKNIYILFLIMALVALFTIICYTLFLDSKQYKYTNSVIGTKIYYQKEETTTLDTVLENITESVVGVSKIKNAGWVYKTKLQDGLRATYRWYLKNYDKFNGGNC